MGKVKAGENKELRVGELESSGRPRIRMASFALVPVSGMIKRRGILGTLRICWGGGQDRAWN